MLVKKGPQRILFKATTEENEHYFWNTEIMESHKYFKDDEKSSLTILYQPNI